MRRLAPAGPRYTRPEPLKKKVSRSRMCRHRPAASLHRQDAVRCEGGKDEAVNKGIARRPKDG